jgi:hypothetical protein
MPYKLFLDDERNPVNPNEWIICRTVEEAKETVKELGYPVEVQLDNDLGTELEGKDFVQFLIEYDLDTGLMPDDFSFNVHSQNVAAAKLMRDKLNAYLAHKMQQVR